MRAIERSRSQGLPQRKFRVSPNGSRKEIEARYRLAAVPSPQTLDLRHLRAAGTPRGGPFSFLMIERARRRYLGAVQRAAHSASTWPSSRSTRSRRNASSSLKRPASSSASTRRSRGYAHTHEQLKPDMNREIAPCGRPHLWHRMGGHKGRPYGLMQTTTSVRPAAGGEPRDERRTPDRGRVSRSRRYR